MPTRKHVGLDAEPVTSDPALQADREEAVVIAGQNASPIAGHAVKSHTDSKAMSASER